MQRVRLALRSLNNKLQNCMYLETGEILRAINELEQALEQVQR